MKAYPKPEKEVVCSVCQKPIQSRDDLILIRRGISSYKYRIEPMHADCFSAAFRKDPQIKSYIKLSVKGVVEVFIAFLVATLLLFFGTEIGKDSESVSLLFAAFPIASIILLFAAFDVNHRVKHVWETFESPLPATCSRCKEKIPPGGNYCPVCKKKYNRSQWRLKKKLKN